MSKNVLIGIVLGVVIIGSGAWWFANQSASAPVVDTSTALVDENNTTPTTPETAPVSGTLAAPADMTPVSMASMHTMMQVSSHNSASSCWSVIDGNVYDLTNWISQHPGGKQAILGLCGKDGTAAFHGQHGDSKKQATMLATMKIGVLAQ